MAVLDAATLAPVATVDVPAGAVAFAGLLAPAPRRRWPLAGAAARAGRAGRAVAAVAPSSGATLASLDGEDVVISDTEFDARADWAVSRPRQAQHVAGADGREPGRLASHDPLRSRRTTVHRLIRPGSQYTPSSAGAICSIDVSWDRRILAETLVSERFLVEQDNVVYRTTERTFFSPTWETDERARPHGRRLRRRQRGPPRLQRHRERAPLRLRPPDRVQPDGPPRHRQLRGDGASAPPERPGGWASRRPWTSSGETGHAVRLRAEATRGRRAPSASMCSPRSPTGAPYRKP